MTKPEVVPEQPGGGVTEEGRSLQAFSFKENRAMTYNMKNAVHIIHKASSASEAGEKDFFGHLLASRR